MRSLSEILHAIDTKCVRQQPIKDVEVSQPNYVAGPSQGNPVYDDLPIPIYEYHIPNQVYGHMRDHNMMILKHDICDHVYYHMLDKHIV